MTGLKIIFQTLILKNLKNLIMAKIIILIIIILIPAIVMKINAICSKPTIITIILQNAI